MSEIKETLKEKYPWMIYIVLFVIVFALFFLFNRFNFFQTNPDSARYMLSALVQSEAAIVAIVITLSLVAVQLTASSYSPRVIEIFRKAPDLWVLMISYIAAIIYGLGILRLIKATPEVNLECCIRFAYFFGIFCFTALIPYTRNMFIMLKPSTIIRELFKNITKENLLNSEENPEADPIQPIIDIVRGSIMKYDYETTRDGIRSVSNSVCTILNKEKLSEKEDEKISKIIRNHFTSIGRLALSMKNEISAIETIENVKEIYKEAIEERLLGITRGTVLSIGAIGADAANKLLEWTVRVVIMYLRDMGETIVKNEKLMKEKDFRYVAVDIRDHLMGIYRELNSTRLHKDIQNFSVCEEASEAKQFADEIDVIIKKFEDKLPTNPSPQPL